MPSQSNSADVPKALGPIRNPYARRRERRGAAGKPAPLTAKMAKAEPAAAKPAAAAKVDERPRATEEVKAEQKPTSKESTPVPSGGKKPAPKRGASGGIMQSFAKAASKPKKAAVSKAAAVSAVEDSSMQALSDDGEDDFVAMPEPKEENEATRKSRKERQEELKRMMEESSEDEEPEKEDTPMEEPEEEPAAPEPEEKADPEPTEVISSTGDGRRRGKRRVKKKKTVMDEQGYLGTSCLHCLNSEAVLIHLQSLSWKMGTSLSRKTNLCPPQKRSRKLRHNLRSRRGRRQRDRATSCHSSARSSTVHPQLRALYCTCEPWKKVGAVLPR